MVGLGGIEGPVVVGCSGGTDSLALLALAADRGLDPVAVHVDHGLRDGSAAESAFVAECAVVVGARVRSETVAVDHGPNLEARARDARYDALERARAGERASAVLVGHTADDQAETVILNLLRGSAGSGLGAMAPRRGAIVRPLLAMRRSDTAAICAAVGFEPLADPMNDDPAHRRVWVRHEVLPLLSEGAGRDLVPVLARQAEILRAESEELDRQARVAWPAAGDAPSASALASLPPVIARRAVRNWLGSPPPSFADVERVLVVARGEARGTELTGGRRVSRRAGRLSLSLDTRGR